MCMQGIPVLFTSHLYIVKMGFTARGIPIFDCGYTLQLPLSTPGPLYNMVHYNTVLDITLIAVGPQLDYFGYMSIHFTLVITWFG